MKKFFAFILFVCLLSALFYFKKTQVTATNQNLVLISVDALRADHMGVYGYSQNTTPNIDKWSKDATVFTNMMTVVPITYPSFAAFFTGKHPFESKIINNYSQRISGSTQTLAAILRKNGYYTVAFVGNKALESKLTGLDTGFNEYHVIGQITPTHQEYEDFINDALISLKKNRSEKLFVWIHLMDPHAPYYPPDDLVCTFGKKYCDDIQKTSLIELERQRERLEGCSDLAPDTIDLYRTLYDGEIAYSDRLFQKIENTLSSYGITKNSIQIVYGDHGEGFDHYQNFIHGPDVYRSATHIPLIIKFSKTTQAKAKRIDAVLENTDLYPTILSLLGINHHNFDGVDFSRFFKEKINTFFGKRFIQFSITGPNNNGVITQYSIYDGRYQYIFSPSRICHNLGDELYDIQKDPLEHVNLASEKPRRSLFYRLLLIIKAAQYRIFNLANSTSSHENGQQKIEMLKSLGY